MHETYLMHWRIKGSKNGIRRFQNDDGSYTEEGRIRHRERARELYGYSPRDEHEMALTIYNANSNRAYGSWDKERYSEPDWMKNVIDVEWRDVTDEKKTSGSKKENTETAETTKIKENTETTKVKENSSNKNKKSTFDNVKDIVKGIEAINKPGKTILSNKKKIKKNDEFFKKVSDIPDEELKKIVARMTLENNYKKAIDGRKVDLGKVSAMDILAAIGGVVTVVGGIKAIIKDE